MVPCVRDGADWVLDLRNIAGTCTLIQRTLVLSDVFGEAFSDAQQTRAAPQSGLARGLSASWKEGATDRHLGFDVHLSRSMVTGRDGCPVTPRAADLKSALWVTCQHIAAPQRRA